MKPKDFAKIKSELEEKFTPEIIEEIRTGKINQEELKILKYEREYDLQEFNESLQILQPYLNKYDLHMTFGLYDSTMSINITTNEESKQPNEIISFNGIRELKDIPMQMTYCFAKTELGNKIKKAGKEISSQNQILAQLKEINDKYITQDKKTKKEKLIIDTIKQRMFRFHLKNRMQKNEK